MRLPGTVFVGVDGGGTGCRARICDAQGQTLAEAQGAAANVYLDFDRAIAALQATIRTGLDRAGLENAPLSIGCGLAGVSSDAVAARVRQALLPLGEVSVTNDGVTACIGAHGGGHGGLVITGTGSVAVLRFGGMVTTFGGRGFHLGDDGSGARMGRDLWHKTLRAYDGLEPWTPLLRRTMAQFEDDPVAVIAWARNAPSHQFASHAPQVFAAADERDPAAVDLVSRAAAAIAELISALHDRGAPRISIAGGMAAAMEPYLNPVAASRLSARLADALSGALILAGAPACTVLGR